MKTACANALAGSLNERYVEESTTLDLPCPSAIGIFACCDKLRLQLRHLMVETGYTVRLFTVDDLPAEGIELLIIDETAARRHWRRLRKMQAEASPLQLPLLLAVAPGRPMPALPPGYDGLLPLPANGMRLAQAMRQALRRRRESETKVESDRQRFRKTFELAPLGMAALSIGGRILSCNPALRSMLDFTEAELLGMVPDEFMPRDEARRLRRQATRAFTFGQPCQIEVRLNARFGRPLWVAMTLTHLRTPSGDSSHVICAVEDISGKKFMEQALSEMKTASANRTLSMPAYPALLKAQASPDGRRQWLDFRPQSLP